MPFRLFAVEVIVERQPPVLAFFTDEDEAQEFARKERRKAVKIQSWELAPGEPAPSKRYLRRR